MPSAKLKFLVTSLEPELSWLYNREPFHMTLVMRNSPLCHTHTHTHTQSTLINLNFLRNFLNYSHFHSRFCLFCFSNMSFNKKFLVVTDPSLEQNDFYSILESHFIFVIYHKVLNLLTRENFTDKNKRRKGSNLPSIKDKEKWPHQPPIELLLVLSIQWFSYSIYKHCSHYNSLLNN